MNGAGVGKRAEQRRRHAGIDLQGSDVEDGGSAVERIRMRNLHGMAGAAGERPVRQGGATVNQVGVGRGERYFSPRLSIFPLSASVPFSASIRPRLTVLPKPTASVPPTAAMAPPASLVKVDGPIELRGTDDDVVKVVDRGLGNPAVGAGKLDEAVALQSQSAIWGDQLVAAAADTQPDHAGVGDAALEPERGAIVERHVDRAGERRRAAVQRDEAGGIDGADAGRGQLAAADAGIRELDLAAVGADGACIDDNAGEHEGAGFGVKQAEVLSGRGSGIDCESAAGGDDRAGGVVVQREPGDDPRADDQIVDVFQRVGGGDADDLAGGECYCPAAA